MWEYLVRFRTWIFNLLLVVVTLAPELLNSPEILALVPADYQRWFLAALFLINIWLRPRPAVMAKDPETFVHRSHHE